MQAIITDLPYLTGDLPGTGGTLRQRPEDFLVDEQPLVDPDGAGEHAFLFLEKRRITTIDAVRRIARAFKVRVRDVGYAGLKDKHAITRQHISIYQPDAGRDAKAVEKINFHPNLNVLWIDRHGRKLRRGHHGGNRFSIRIRDVRPEQVLSARRVLDRLVESGMPNFLGEQRFGYRLNGHLLGRHLLLGEHQAFIDEMLGRRGATDVDPLRIGRDRFHDGDYAGALEVWPRKLRHERQALDSLRQGRDPERVVRSIDPVQLRFLATVMQSSVFNTVVDRRMREGTLAKLVPGDLAWKDDSRSVFAVDEEVAAVENAPGGRVERLEVSPSGPMWGTDMTRAAGAVDESEHEALRDEGLTIDQLERLSEFDVNGSRRPMRVAVRDPQIDAGADEHGPYIRVVFELPRGSFATIALREIMKVRLEGEKEQEAVTGSPSPA